jgi:predicted HTH domain antitoxin
LGDFPDTALAECCFWVHAFTVQLTLPEAIEAKLSSKDAALHLAIGLFVTNEATLGQAAEVAGISQADFLKELGRRRIPIHYGPDELAEDLRVVEAFGKR